MHLNRSSGNIIICQENYIYILNQTKIVKNEINAVKIVIQKVLRTILAHIFFDDKKNQKRFPMLEYYCESHKEHVSTYQKSLKTKKHALMFATYKVFKEGIVIYFTASLRQSTDPFKTNVASFKSRNDHHIKSLN